MSNKERKAVVNKNLRYAVQKEPEVFEISIETSNYDQFEKTKSKKLNF